MHSVWFYFHEILEQAGYSVETENMSVVASEKAGRKGAGEKFLGDKNVILIVLVVT